MNVRNLLADAFDSAASRIRNNSCGMTDEEMESALHKMLYLLDSDHHFKEDNARATIAQMLCSVLCIRGDKVSLRQDSTDPARRLQFLGLLCNCQSHVLKSHRNATLMVPRP